MFGVMGKRGLSLSNFLYSGVGKGGTLTLFFEYVLPHYIYILNT